MGFSEAVLGLTMVVIVLAVFIPVTAQLLPSIIQYSGAMTGMMVSTIVVVIIAAALFMLMRQSMAPGHAEIQGY